MTRPNRLFLALLFALSTGLVAGCGQDGHDHSAKKTATASKDGKAGDGHAHEKEKGAGGPLNLSNDEIAAAGIEVADVTEEEMNERVQATAVVRPDQTRLARVAPRISGRIVTVNINVGDRVRAGQTLAVLDSLELGEARSAHHQAQSELALTRDHLERTEKLLAEEIIAAKELARARSDFEKARIAVRASADKLRLLGVSPDRDHETTSSTFALTSPFAGTVIERSEAVTGALSNPDKPLFTVADLSSVWVEANLLEAHLGRVAVGNEAEVTLAAYPGAVFKGKVTYVSAIMDKETRTVPARIEVRNPDGRLKQEMFARVAIATTSKRKALLIPNEALVLMQGQSAVFVEDAHGFEVRLVEIGERLGGRVSIKEGLKAGDSIVVKGTYSLKARQLKSQIGEGHAH